MMASSLSVMLARFMLAFSFFGTCQSFFGRKHFSKNDKKDKQRRLQVPPRFEPTPAPTFSYTSFPTTTPPPIFTQAPGSSNLVAGPSCNDAAPINVPRNVDLWRFFDSGTNSLQDPEPFDGVCPVINAGAHTVYYHVSGNERCFEASTVGSDFDTVMAVYKGSSCDQEMTCYAQNDDVLTEEPDGGVSSTLYSKLTFHANFDAEYWIVVAGYSDLVGNYELLVVEVDCPINIASNTACSSSVPVTPPAEYTANFDFLPLTNLDQHLPNCPIGEVTGTLWYKVVGDGSCLQARAASNTPGVEVAFALLEENSDCVMSGCPLSFSIYNPDGDESMIQWRAIEGKTYYIVLVDLASDLASATVSFDSMTCPEEDGSGTCDDPAIVSSFPYFYSGSFGFMRPTYDLYYECPSGPYSYYEEKRIMWFQLPIQEETYCLSMEVSTWDTYVDIVQSYDGFTPESCFEVLGCHESLSTFPKTVKVPAQDAYYALAWSPYDGPLSLNLTIVECPVAPPNDDCTNATVIETFSDIKASLEHAEPLSSRLSCYPIEYGYPSVWYKFEGTGSCISVNVTEHEMELFIGVMEGSDCFNLTCLTYTFLSFAEPGGATFLAEEGSSYYVVVAVPWYTQAGPFTLIAGETSGCPRPPENDSCEESVHTASLPVSFSGSINLAKPYRPNTWVGSSPSPSTYFPGENWDNQYPFERPPRFLDEERPPLFEPLYDDDYGWEGAIDDYYTENEESDSYPHEEVGCHFYDQIQTVWYRMDAQEKVCLNITIASDFYGSIVIFQGDSCTTLECSTSSQYWFYGGNNTFYHTLPEDSTSYFVVTKETYEYGGLFDLSFEPVDCPGLDSCSEAGVISGLPFVTFESNVFAFPEPAGSPAGSCRFSFDSRTQWYYLPTSLAQGRCFAIFLFSEFASVLGVVESFDESCEFLSCLYYNSYFNGLARFRVDSAAVYIVIGGATQYDYGDYILTLDEEDCDAISTHTNCSSAEAIDNIPATFEVDFSGIPKSGGYLPAGSCSLYSQWKTLWYTLPIVFDETCLQATSSEEGIGIVVFDGMCSTLGCASGNEEDRFNQARLWRALPGVQYFLVATADQYMNSKIMIDITTLPCPTNDSFESAIFIDDTDFWHSSSTKLSRTEPFDSVVFSCGGFPRETRTNWYRMEGNGSCISVSVFGNFETYLAVYMGNTTSNLTCIAVDSYQGKLSFPSQNSTIYNIVVGATPYSFASEDYTLLVSSDADCQDISSSTCESAVIVDENSFPLSSFGMQSPSNTQLQEFPGECYLNYDWRSSWYQLRLNSSSTMPMCARLSVEMDVYGRVMVLNGTCDNPRCMGAREGYSASLPVKVHVNETYLFAISARNRARANSFSIDLQMIECVENDSCHTAASYRSLPIVETTTNELSVPASWSSPGRACPSFPSNAKGTWYRFEGTGTCVTIDAWGLRRAYIGVYSGYGCENLRCITEELRSDHQISFLASSETLYFIFVGESYSSSTGEYTVLVTESPEGCARIPTNNECDSADLIVALPSSVQATLPLVEIPTNPTQAPFLDFFDQTSRPTLDDPRVSAPTDSPGRPLWTNPFGPATLENLVFYVVESDASFSCALAGSRCAFLRSDFEDIDEEGGAIADQREGTVWTVVEPEIDVLNLIGCEAGSCISTCFRDCVCLLPDGSDCSEMEPPMTPSPSSVMGTPPPTDYVTGDACGLPESSKTLWYQVIPDESGGDCVRASVTGGGVDSVVVFSGSCAEMTCIGTSFFNRREQQEIVWETDPDSTYYVAIRGSYGYFQEPGLDYFTLEIDSVPCLDNDSCLAAKSIVDLPFVDVTNSETASPLEGESGYVCNRLARGARGVWYEYLGAGGCMSVYVWSTFGVFIGVYAGEDCESMNCLIQEVYDDRAVSFFAEDGQIYRLLVSGPSPYETGDIVVTVTTGSDCPTAEPNTNCSQAVSIEKFPYEVEQSSEIVSIFRQSFGCGAWYDRKKLFYKIQLEESTCLSAVVKSTSTTYYRGLQVSVFEASSENCASLTCLKEGGVERSEADGLLSQVSFKAVSGKIYYLMVLDEEFSSGTTFKLTVHVKECVENDTCGTARLVDPPFLEVSTTEFSLASSLLHNSSTVVTNSTNSTLSHPHDNSVSVCATLGNNVGYNYYRVLGPPEGACVGVSLFSRFETSIGVLVGDCNSLSCLTQKTFWSGTGDPTLKFFVEPDTSYTIAVGSNSRQAGQYFVNIDYAEDCPTALENSSCEQAVDIALPTTILAGSHQGPVPPFGDYISGSCGLYERDRTLWYSLGPFTMETCVKVSSFSNLYEERYESDLLLLSGASCDDLFCATSSSSELAWKIEAGDIVWLVVRYEWYFDNIDEFQLRFEEIECTDNDICESSKILTDLPTIDESGPALSTGDNLAGNPTNASNVCSMLARRYGDFRTRWYQVTADEDSCMEVAVFGSSEVTIGIHGGSDCNLLTCLAMSTGYGSVSTAWQAVSGESYNIGVGAYGESDFTVLFDERDCDDLQTNTLCTRAERLSNTPVTGSLDTAALSPEADGQDLECGFGATDTQLWYELDPSSFQGPCITLSFNGYLTGGFAIVEGTGCASLSCLHAGGPLDDAVTFLLQNSTTYYVVVYDDSNIIHDGVVSSMFSLSLLEAECTGQYTCQEPLAIDSLPFVDLPSSDTLTIKDVSGYLASSPSCDGLPNSTFGFEEFWYSFTGTGGCLSAFVWSGHYEAIHAGVYKGDECGDLVCVARLQMNYQTEGTSFLTEEGGSYKLQVLSRSWADDTLVTLTASDLPCKRTEQNSFCGTAKPIIDVFHNETGNLAGAAVYGHFLGTGNCYVPEYSRSLWYRLSADILGTTNTSCMEASFKAISGWVDVNVFTGAGCDSLRCVSRIYQSGRTNWKVSPGETYYIALVSNSDGPADFVLTTSEIDCSEVTSPTPYPSWTPYPSTTATPTDWYYPSTPPPSSYREIVDFEMVGNTCETTAFQLVCKAEGFFFPPYGNLHIFSLSVQCDLTAQSAFDFRTADECESGVEIMDAESGLEKGCRASVCPAGFGESPISFDCGGVRDALSEGCSSMDCNFECNGPCVFGCEYAGPSCRLCRDDGEFEEGHGGEGDYDNQNQQQPEEEYVPP